MDLQEYVKFANENPTCYLATADGDQPRVRGMGMCFADDTGFYFNTEFPKALARQLHNNPKVEVCYFAKGKVMRVTGEVEFIDDIEIRTRIFNDRRTLLEGVGVRNAADPKLVVFAIRTGEAFFWTPADNLKEAEIERLKF
jgi:pyridoxamine 5'-phosphate oxidase